MVKGVFSVFSNKNSKKKDNFVKTDVKVGDLNKKLTELERTFKLDQKSFKQQMIRIVKTDLMEELSPILKKLDLNSNNNALSEIEKVLDKEILKAKIEFDKLVSKNSKETLAKILRIEDRILKNVGNSNNLNKLLKEFEEKGFEKIFNRVENEVSKNKADLLSKVELVSKSFDLSLEDQRKELDSQRKEFENLKFNFNSLSKSLTGEKIDFETEKEQFLFGLENNILNKFSALSNKFSSVEKDFANFKSEIYKVSNEAVSQEIVKLNSFKKTQEEASLNKLNFLEENIENKFLGVKKQFEENFNEHLASFSEKLTEKESEFLSKLLVIENDKNLMVSELSEFEKQITSLSNDFVQKLDGELKKIKIEEGSLAKNKDMFISELNDFSNNAKHELSLFSSQIKSEIHTMVALERDKFELSENGFKDLFHKKVSNLHEFLEKRLNSIENKFVEKNLKVISKAVESEIYKINLLKEEIISKEESLTKMAQELDVKISQTFEDITLNIKTLSSDGNNEISKRSTQFKIAIDEFKKDSETQLRNISEQQILFSEEINLKLKSLREESEKDFTEKSSKVQKEMESAKFDLDKEISNISEQQFLLSQEINLKLDQKAERTENLINDVSEKSNTMLEKISAEQKSLNEKAELRLSELEKQLNRRFLDYDSKFTSFKGVVIAEVEDLMKEVNKVVSDKMLIVDQNITKLSGINDKISKKINDFDKIHDMVEKQISEVRDDIADLHVKLDIIVPSTSLNSVNEHVHYMKEYEGQLVALIKNLKSRNISDTKIREILVTKGHPRFYVIMIMRNFNEFF